MNNKDRVVISRDADDIVRLLAIAREALALLEDSQRNLTGDWRERRDALLERLNGDEE